MFAARPRLFGSFGVVAWTLSAVGKLPKICFDKLTAVKATETE